MNWFEGGVLFLVALLSTMALIPAAKRLAHKCDAIDYPGGRRVNTKAIPRLGGLALFGGVFISLVVMLLGMQFFEWPSPFTPHPNLSVHYSGVALGVLAIFLVGVVDDIVDLNAKIKFLGQIVAACIVAASGLLLSSIYNPFSHSFIEFGWLSYPLTVFYLVAFANIINLIDGLDGLAAGITAITAATITVFAVMTGRYDAAFLGLALIGACIGFLKSNFYPASIFMGDSGALFLGFSLGVVSLFAVARSALFVSLLVPIIAAGVPITDTALSIIRRKRANIPIDEADRGHIHHRIMDAGYSQKATTFIMWGWTAILSVCAFLITEIHGVARIPIFLIIAGVTAFAVIKLDLLGPALQHHYYPDRNKPKHDSSDASEGKNNSPHQ